MNHQKSPVAWKGFRAVAIGGLVFLYAIGLTISTRALYLLPQGKERGPDGHSYPAWTVLHFASALVFVVLAMMQLSSALRRRYPPLHRYAGRVAVVFGLIAAVTGALIPFALVPPRPLIEQIYIVLYFTGVASCLLSGFRAARRRDYTLHRLWMVRAVASAAAVMTQRIAFSVLAIAFGFHNESDFWIGFVAAFALGWAINLGLAEVWLRWQPARVTLAV